MAVVFIRSHVALGNLAFQILLCVVNSSVVFRTYLGILNVFIFNCSHDPLSFCWIIGNRVSSCKVHFSILILCTNLISSSKAQAFIYFCLIFFNCFFDIINGTPYVARKTIVNSIIHISSNVCVRSFVSFNSLL